MGFNHEMYQPERVVIKNPDPSDLNPIFLTTQQDPTLQLRCIVKKQINGHEIVASDVSITPADEASDAESTALEDVYYNALSHRDGQSTTELHLQRRSSSRFIFDALGTVIGLQLFSPSPRHLPLVDRIFQTALAPEIPTLNVDLIGTQEEGILFDNFGYPSEVFEHVKQAKPEEGEAAMGLLRNRILNSESVIITK